MGKSNGNNGYVDTLYQLYGDVVTAAGKQVKSTRDEFYQKLQTNPAYADFIYTTLKDKVGSRDDYDASLGLKKKELSGKELVAQQEQKKLEGKISDSSGGTSELQEEPQNGVIMRMGLAADKAEEEKTNQAESTKRNFYTRKEILNAELLYGKDSPTTTKMRDHNTEVNYNPPQWNKFLSEEENYKLWDAQENLASAQKDLEQFKAGAINYQDRINPLQIKKEQAVYEQQDIIDKLQTKANFRDKDNYVGLFDLQTMKPMTVPKPEFNDFINNFIQENLKFRDEFQGKKFDELTPDQQRVVWYNFSSKYQERGNLQQYLSDNNFNVNLDAAPHAGIQVAKGSLGTFGSMVDGLGIMNREAEADVINELYLKAKLGAITKKEYEDGMKKVVDDIRGGVNEQTGTYSTSRGKEFPGYKPTGYGPDGPGGFKPAIYNQADLEKMLSNMPKYEDIVDNGAKQPFPDNGLTELAKKFDEWGSLMPSNPKFNKNWALTTVPQALGSTGAFALTALGGGVTQGVRVALTGGLSSASHGYRDAISNGGTAHDAELSYLANFGLGTTEAIPVVDWLNRMKRITGSSMFVEAMLQGSEEMIQESVQQLGSNFTAQQLYDEARSIQDGVFEGGSAGFASGFLMTMAGFGLKYAVGLTQKDKTLLEETQKILQPIAEQEFGEEETPKIEEEVNQETTTNEKEVEVPPITEDSTDGTETAETETKSEEIETKTTKSETITEESEKLAQETEKTEPDEQTEKTEIGKTSEVLASNHVAAEVAIADKVLQDNKIQASKSIDEIYSQENAPLSEMLEASEQGYADAYDIMSDLDKRISKLTSDKKGANKVQKAEIDTKIKDLQSRKGDIENTLFIKQNDFHNQLSKKLVTRAKELGHTVNDEDVAALSQYAIPYLTEGRMMENVFHSETVQSLTDNLIEDYFNVESQSVKTKSGVEPNEHGLFDDEHEEVEQIKMPTKKNQKVNAKIGVVQLENDKWISNLSTQNEGPDYFGQSYPLSAIIAFDTKEEAIINSAEKILKSEADNKIKEWAKEVIANNTKVAAQEDIKKIFNESGAREGKVIVGKVDTKKKSEEKGDGFSISDEIEKAKKANGNPELQDKYKVLANGTYQKAIADGIMTAEDATNILEAAGVEVPATISKSETVKKTIEKEIVNPINTDDTLDAGGKIYEVLIHENGIDTKDNAIKYAKDTLQDDNISKITVTHRLYNELFPSEDIPSLSSVESAVIEKIPEATNSAKKERIPLKVQKQDLLSKIKDALNILLGENREQYEKINSHNNAIDAADLYPKDEIQQANDLIKSGFTVKTDDNGNLTHVVFDVEGDGTFTLNSKGLDMAFQEVKKLFPENETFKTKSYSKGGSKRKISPMEHAENFSSIKEVENEFDNSKSNYDSALAEVKIIEEELSSTENEKNKKRLLDELKGAERRVELTKHEFDRMVEVRQAALELDYEAIVRDRERKNVESELNVEYKQTEQLYNELFDQNEELLSSIGISSPRMLFDINKKYEQNNDKININDIVKTYLRVNEKNIDLLISGKEADIEKAKSNYNDEYLNEDGSLKSMPSRKKQTERTRVESYIDRMINGLAAMKDYKKQAIKRGDIVEEIIETRVNRSSATVEKTKLVADQLVKRLKQIFPNVNVHLLNNDDYMEASKKATIKRSFAEPVEMGFFDPESGEIYLNRDTLVPGAVVEEFSHLWLYLLENINNPIYKKGEALAKSHPLFEQLKTDEGYMDIWNNDEELANETLAKLIRDEVLREMGDKTWLQNFRKWLGEMWDSVKSILRKGGINLDQPDINKITLEDLVKGATKDILKTTPVTYMTSEQIANLSDADSPVYVDEHLKSHLINPQPDGIYDEYIRSNMKKNLLLYRGASKRLGEIYKQTKFNINAHRHGIGLTMKDFQTAVKTYSRELSFTGEVKNDEISQTLQNVNAYLHGEKNLNDLPEALRDSSKAIREQIDSFTREIMKSRIALDDDIVYGINEELELYLDNNFNLIESFDKQLNQISKELQREQEDIAKMDQDALESKENELRNGIANTRELLKNRKLKTIEALIKKEEFSKDKPIAAELRRQIERMQNLLKRVEVSTAQAKREPLTPHEKELNTKIKQSLEELQAISSGPRLYTDEEILLMEDLKVMQDLLEDGAITMRPANIAEMRKYVQAMANKLSRRRQWVINEEKMDNAVEEIGYKQTSESGIFDISFMHQNGTRSEFWKVPIKDIETLFGESIARKILRDEEGFHKIAPTILENNKLFARMMANMGKYVTRSYKLHDMPDFSKRWRELVGPEIYKEAFYFIKTQYQDSSIHGVKVIASPDGKFSVKFKNKYGIESEEIIVKNLDQLLTSNNGVMTSSDLKLLKNQLRADGGISYIVLTKPTSKQSFVKFKMSKETIDNIIQKIVTRDGYKSIYSGLPVDGFDGSIFKKKGDIADPIRALMGEYLDPFTNATKTLLRMSTAIENGRLVQQMIDEGPGLFLSDRQTKYHTVKLTKEDLYSLGERIYYVTPEVYDLLLSDKKAANHHWFWDLWISMSGMAKAANTIYFPESQARNFFGAALNMIATGNVNFSDLKYSISVASQDMTKVQGYGTFMSTPLFIMRGIAGKNFGYHGKAGDGKYDKNHLRQVFLDASRFGVINENLDVNVINDLHHLMSENKVKEMYANATDAFAKPYQLTDNIFKVAQWINEQKTLRKAYPDMSDEQVMKKSADIVRRTAPTYSELPEAFRRLARFPVMASFVMFTSSMVRTRIEIIKQISSEFQSGNTILMAKAAKRSAGLISTMMMGYALFRVFAYMFDWEDEENEAVNVLSPSYAQNNLRLYLSSDKKNVEFLDLTYIDPSSSFYKSIIAFHRDEGKILSKTKSAITEFATPYTSVDIFTQSLLEVIRNEDEAQFPIYNKSDSDMDKTRKVVGNMLQSIIPRFVDSYNRIYMAATGSENDWLSRNIMGVNYNKVYELDNELENLMLGAKARVIDERKSGKRKIMASFDMIQEPPSLFKNGEISIDEANERAQYYFEEILLYTEALKTLGFEDDEIYGKFVQKNKKLVRDGGVLQDAGLPAYLIEQIADKKFLGVDETGKNNFKGN